MTPPTSFIESMTVSFAGPLLARFSSLSSTFQLQNIVTFFQSQNEVMRTTLGALVLSIVHAMSVSRSRICVRGRQNMLIVLFSDSQWRRSVFFKTCRETHESIGLLKSGNLMGGPVTNSHLVCSCSTRTDLLLMTIIWTLTPPQNRTCRKSHGHS